MLKPERKQRKPISCSRCRNRRARCDRKRPHCGRCLLDDTTSECLYSELPDPVPKTNTKKRSYSETVKKISKPVDEVQLGSHVSSESSPGILTPNSIPEVNSVDTSNGFCKLFGEALYIGPTHYFSTFLHDSLAYSYFIGFTDDARYPDEVKYSCDPDATLVAPQRQVSS